MNKEQLRMQMIAGIITESQYKTMLMEMEHPNDNEVKELFNMLKNKLGGDVEIDMRKVGSDDDEGVEYGGESDGYLKIFIDDEGNEFEVDKDEDKFHVYYMDEDGDYYFDRAENVIAFIQKEISRARD